MKVLDPYYFVINEKKYDEALERGLEVGLDLVRVDPDAFASELAKKLL